MGIIGLENFMDEMYNSYVANNVIKLVKLKDIKLVIDANQIPYYLNDIFKSSEYGGDYDEMYANVRSFFEKLKPFIHILIFDGAKDNEEKAYSRLAQKISRIANLEQQKGRRVTPSLNTLEHFQLLKKYPALFARSLIYEVLDELEIKYIMADKMADELIAAYASGHNQNNGHFTVVTKDTYFYVFKFKEGFLSLKHAFKIFENFSTITEETEVPVFYIHKMLDHLEIDWKTWVYFCLICGDYDYLPKNVNYLRKNYIDTRNGYNNLLNHLKNRQNEFLTNNYKRIRDTYEPEMLKTIDELFQMFELKNNYEELNKSIIDYTNLNDFDRVLVGIKEMANVYMSCLIENCKEKSVFSLSVNNQLYNLIYFEMTQKRGLEHKSIVEYQRMENPLSEANCIVENKVKIVKINSEIFNYLKKRNDFLTQDRSISDDTTLLFTALSICHKGMNSRNDGYSPELLIDAILTNLLIINLKKNLNNGINENGNEIVGFQNINELFKIHWKDQDKEAINNLIELYDEMRKVNEKHNLNDYFNQDLQLIHRVNEFQALYFTLGILNKVSFDFKFLSPSQFLNARFVCKFMVKDNHKSINEIISNTDALAKIKNELSSKFKSTFNDLFKAQVDSLEKSMKTLNLTKN